MTGTHRSLLSVLATVGLVAALASPASANTIFIADPVDDAKPKYDMTSARITAEPRSVSAKFRVPDLKATGTVAVVFRQDNAKYADYEYYGLVTRTKEAGAKGYVYVRSFADEEYRRVDCPITKSWKVDKGLVRVTVGLGGDSECPRFDPDLTARVYGATAASTLGLVIDYVYEDLTNISSVGVG